ncbi:MAG: HAMP domain-containing protein [Gallionella sp.]|nr:HAMP domain-containing protein [Gallionella sp.]
MFKTIRAKLIGLCLLSLLLITLIVAAAHFAGDMLAKQFSGAEQNLAEMSSYTQESALHELVRADVIQLLQAGKAGDAPAHDAAVNVLNADLKTLIDSNASKKAAVMLTGKTRQAFATVRFDVVAYAKLAQEIGAMPIADFAAADARWVAFSEAYKTLKANQVTANNLMPGEIKTLRDATHETSSMVDNFVWIVGGLALAVLTLFIYYAYRGITQPLTHIRSVCKKVMDGAYDARVNLHSNGELAVVAGTIDALLDARSEAISVAAKENERLNNSVIGLFVAMGALAEKDLTVRAPVTEDIIGTLGDAINQLTDVTATVLHHVTKIAGVVEHASERMKQQSDMVNVMSKEEDVIVARLTANLETAMTSMGEVAVLAKDSNQAATEATKSTESAMHTVQATLSGMNVIRETISEMEKRIKRLGERSQEISQIVNLINTISERTHVLSLNAAMQAAMAGDAGRGFAVVAEEVQRLAENSRQATGQIANLVQNIQVETNDTIATVNKTIDQVVKESELAHNAGERMRETHEATARLVQLVATIANSSAEQTKIAVSLRSAADEITQFSAKTSEQLTSQNQSAASLVAASKKLMESVSVFKLPPPNA